MSRSQAATPKTAGRGLLPTTRRISAPRSTPICTTCASSVASPRRPSRPTGPTSRSSRLGRNRIERWKDTAGARARLARRPRASTASAPPGQPPSQGGGHPRLLSLLLRRGADRPRRGGTAGPSAPGAPAAGHARRRPGRGAARGARSAAADRKSAIERCWSCCTRPDCASARRSGSIATTSRSTVAGCA